MQVFFHRVRPPIKLSKGRMVRSEIRNGVRLMIIPYQGQQVCPLNLVGGTSLIMVGVMP